jgi:hypothetical protein
MSPNPAAPPGPVPHRLSVASRRSRAGAIPRSGWNLQACRGPQAPGLLGRSVPAGCVGGAEWFAGEPGIRARNRPLTQPTDSGAGPSFPVERGAVSLRIPPRAGPMLSAFSLALHSSSLPPAQTELWFPLVTESRSSSKIDHVTWRLKRNTVGKERDLPDELRLSTPPCSLPTQCSHPLHRSDAQRSGSTSELYDDVFQSLVSGLFPWGRPFRLFIFIHRRRPPSFAPGQITHRSKRVSRHSCVGAGSQF